MKRFPLRWFTNREIIATGCIVTAFWCVAGLHWLGLVTGLVMAPAAVWLTRKTINDDYSTMPNVIRIKRLFGRLFGGKSG